MLYHLLFVVVDLRRILRRVSNVTEQVEDVIMKPIGMADSLLEWLMETVEHHAKKKHKEKHEK
ncbi:MAG: hypothetical protein PHI23_03675 [Candidatus Peribacteraceae bacterium]|nr:hypothetical protein [Candidatus Peribacteraceae bacterium]